MVGTFPLTCLPTRCIFDQAYPAKSLLGAALAACAILAYTSINLREQEQQKLLAKQRDPSP